MIKRGLFPPVYVSGYKGAKVGESNNFYKANGKANIAQAEYLAKDIEKRTVQNIFTSEGGLSNSAIKEARKIQDLVDYNPKAPIYKELSKRGNLEDWGKYRTQTFSTPERSRNIGRSKRNIEAEVHFYKNKATGEVYLEKDFKVKYHVRDTPHVSVDEFLKSLPKSWEAPKP